MKIVLFPIYLVVVIIRPLLAIAGGVINFFAWLVLVGGLGILVFQPWIETSWTRGVMMLAAGGVAKFIVAFVLYLSDSIILKYNE